MATSLYSTLQDFFWPASIVAVKASDGFRSYEEFYRYTLDNLPQNSPETRRRYGNLIQRRYFPECSLNGVIPAVWASYHDERLLTDVMSPDLAGFINRLLATESILTAPTDILDWLAQNYLSLEENEIEAVVDQFRQMLKQAFAEAKKANPDKKTIRLTLR